MNIVLKVKTVYKQFRAIAVKNAIDASIVIFVLNALNVKTANIVISVMICVAQTIASIIRVAHKKNTRNLLVSWMMIAMSVKNAKIVKTVFIPIIVLSYMIVFIVRTALTVKVALIVKNVATVVI